MLSLFILFVVGFIIFIGYKKYRYKKEPLLMVKAKLTKKEINRYSNKMPNRYGLSSMSMIEECVFIFELENRERLELLVDKTEYEKFFEGDEGLLSFQGTRYFGFERS